MKYRNIILTGFMGTGKSSVGKLLAEETGFVYRDLDALIVAETGKSINDIFAEQGEQFFRGLESKIVSRVAQDRGQVISTGGGAVISAENRQLLHAAGAIVNLTAPISEICLRLEGDADRPLLRHANSRQRIEEMLAEREPYYADADIRIDTGGKKVEDVVAEILDFIRRSG